MSLKIRTVKSLVMLHLSFEASTCCSGRANASARAQTRKPLHSADERQVAAAGRQVQATSLE
jgi:hypothetical protein